MRIHLWNTALSLFFLALLIAGGSWLFETNRVVHTIPLLDLAILTLAIFRLVRLFTYDVITKFIREWFTDAKPNSFRHTVGELLNCPWCTGLWFSAFVLFFYFATPYAWPLFVLLALAAAASFLQVLSNLTGWHAESKKRSVLRDQ